jgi:nucleoside-diphosphate-sugar epimerase
MRAVVTGAAGFVGSHLCEHLLEEGATVVGVDCFTDNYERGLKEDNLKGLLGRPGFRIVRADLASARLEPLLEGADTVFHLAGQPGVRPSWGKDFGVYVRNNIVATQRLLEALRGRSVRKLVYASSSSIYGNAETLPTAETVCPAPVSPYGMTKLAGEHLCSLYGHNFGLPVVGLRLFTVYGPRQRPDMAFRRLVTSGLRGRPFELYGDGDQTRDFTFVGDVVRAMRDSALKPWEGVANIGGGSRTSMNEVIRIVDRIMGGLEVLRRSAQRGDARHTSADTSLASASFGYHPATTLEEGLAAMVAWARDRAVEAA